MRCGIPAHEQSRLKEASAIIVHLEARPTDKWWLPRFVIHEAVLPPIGATLAIHGGQE